MKHNFFITALLLFLLLNCTNYFSSYEFYSKNSKSNEFALIRHFNSNILSINGVENNSDEYTFYIEPGNYEILIQPSMFVSSFPMGNHLDETKYLILENIKENTIVYICLGLKTADNNVPLKYEWKPYYVEIPSNINPKNILISEMKKKGGCISDLHTLPYVWYH